MSECRNCGYMAQVDELEKNLELKELVRDARPLIESKIYTITNEEYLKRSEEALSK